MAAAAAAAAVAVATAESPRIGSKRKYGSDGDAAESEKKRRAGEVNGMTFSLCWRKDQSLSSRPVLKVGQTDPIYIPLIKPTEAKAAAAAAGPITEEHLARDADGRVEEWKKTYEPVVWSTFHPGESVRFSVAFAAGGACFVVVPTPTGNVYVRLSKPGGCTLPPLVVGADVGSAVSVLDAACEVPWRPRSDAVQSRIAIAGVEGDVIVPPINVEEVAALSGITRRVLTARQGNEPATPPVDAFSYATLASEADASLEGAFA